MIYCIGESLYDIVFKDNQPSWGVPGGGMLNTAISLGHAGVQVELISELGNDNIANAILSTLESSNVGTHYIVSNDNNTTLALAFVDEAGNASYQFYLLHPAKSPSFKVPDFQSGDIIMFGSIYSIEHRNRENIMQILEAAKKKNVIIYYDPNIRPSKMKNISTVINYIEENINLADLVRGSDEDFKHILPVNTGDVAFSYIKRNGTDKLIYTRGSEGVTLFYNDKSKEYDSLPVNVISTIGAGDSFNAGVVFELSKLKRLPENEEEWGNVITTGLTFAAEVCGSRSNYISKRI